MSLGQFVRTTPRKFLQSAAAVIQSITDRMYLRGQRFADASACARKLPYSSGPINRPPRVFGCRYRVWTQSADVNLDSLHAGLLPAHSCDNQGLPGLGAGVSANA